MIAFSSWQAGFVAGWLAGWLTCLLTCRLKQPADCALPLYCAIEPSWNSKQENEVRGSEKKGLFVHRNFYKTSGVRRSPVDFFAMKPACFLISKGAQGTGGLSHEPGDERTEPVC